MRQTATFCDTPRATVAGARLTSLFSVSNRVILCHAQGPPLVRILSRCEETRTSVTRRFLRAGSFFVFSAKPRQFTPRSGTAAIPARGWVSQHLLFSVSNWLISAHPRLRPWLGSFRGGKKCEILCIAPSPGRATFCFLRQTPPFCAILGVSNRRTGYRVRTTTAGRTTVCARSPWASCPYSYILYSCSKGKGGCWTT